MRFDDTPLLWTIDDVLDASECAEMCTKIERSAPSIATHNPLYRNQDRVMGDDPTFAADLFARIRANLPERIGDFELATLNARLRWYRYRAGQEFSPHMDHWYQPTPKRITLLTVLVYLNHGFEGGDTRFMEQVEERIRPHAGRVAVFQHKIRHEGERVTKGVKYALRTDVLYDAPHPIERQLT